MSVFYLMRHGEPDWFLAGERGLIGWGNDLVPLTERGCGQVEATARELRERRPELILSSPMTRALQSASILGRCLDLPLRVEFDLHEWIPDATMRWDGLEPVLAALEDRTRSGGEWPAGESRDWEPLSRVRRRVGGVLQRYRHGERLVVVCHEEVIYALTERRLGHAEWCTYEPA